MRIRAIIFDLGNTLVHQQVDAVLSLDRMTLILLPHVATIVPELASLYRLGIVTNTTQSASRHVRAALRRLGIAKYFSSIVTSAECGAEKPDPRSFLAVLEALHVMPRESVMIGNDPLQDIAGARALGLRTGFCAVVSDVADVAADFSFGDYRELPRHIAELEDVDVSREE